MLLVAVVSAVSGGLYGYDTGIISGALLQIAPEFGLGDTAKSLVTASILLGAVIGALGCSVLSAADRPAPDPAAHRRRVHRRGDRRGPRAQRGAAGDRPPRPRLRGRRRHPDRADVRRRARALGAARAAGALLPGGDRGRHRRRDARRRHRVVDWRWSIGATAVVAAIMLGALLGLPESPRWLVSQDRDDEARAVLERVRPSGRDVEPELERDRVDRGGRARREHPGLAGPARRLGAARADRGLRRRDLHPALGHRDDHLLRPDDPRRQRVHRRPVPRRERRPRRHLPGDDADRARDHRPGGAPAAHPDHGAGHGGRPLRARPRVRPRRRRPGQHPADHHLPHRLHDLQRGRAAAHGLAHRLGDLPAGRALGRHQRAGRLPLGLQPADLHHGPRHDQRDRGRRDDVGLRGLQRPRLDLRLVPHAGAHRAQPRADRGRAARRPVHPEGDRRRYAGPGRPHPARTRVAPGTRGVGRLP